MMDDRELLELAAKAAGLELSFGDEGVLYKPAGSNYFIGKWNPLKDDGDCARMCAALWISTTYSEAKSLVIAWRWDSDGNKEEFIEVVNDHPNTATAWRLAAVRCAAEIQRAREPK